MQNVKGWWLPDGDEGFARIFDTKDGLPLLDGMPTYQHRKYVAAKQQLSPTKRYHALDIGAHVGLWTRMLVKDFSYVTAFEPIPNFRECWELNMRGVKNCILQPCALGKDHGRVDLVVKRGSSGTTHIVSEAGDDTVSAEMLTLDSFRCVNVDFIKIDCEGYEHFVIQGGEETIRRFKPVMVVEQKEGTRGRYGLPFQSGIELLQSWGATRGVEIGGDHVLYWKD